MQLETWLLYVVAVFVLTVTPGPCVLMCVTHSVKYGMRHASASALGSITANCLLIVVVAVGFATVLTTSEKAFQIVKWVGAAYLLYLGITTFFMRESDFEMTENSPVSSSQSLLRLYLHGFAIGITNPKDLLFFSAFLPQFLDPKAAQLPQYLAMGLTFVVFEVVLLAFYSSFAAKAAPWLRVPGRAKTFNRVTGGIFIGAGALLASAKRAQA